MLQGRTPPDSPKAGPGQVLGPPRGEIGIVSLYRYIICMALQCDN